MRAHLPVPVRRKITPMEGQAVVPRMGNLAATRDARMSAAKAPSDQWWVINGDDLMNALTSANKGDSPSIIYVELIANSEVSS